MSEADRRREDSIYFREGVEPERLLDALAKLPPGQPEQQAVVHGSHRGHLTPAELQVVKLLSHGYNIKMAAEQLERSPNTVKSQIKSAKAALNAKTREHLVAIALRDGLIG